MGKLQTTWNSIILGIFVPAHRSCERQPVQFCVQQHLGNRKVKSED